MTPTSTSPTSTRNRPSTVLLNMIENPSDYYNAFGESSSQSFHFPTQGNLDPPAKRLKRYGDDGDGEEPSTAPTSPQAQQQESQPPKSKGKKTLKRYVPEEGLQEEQQQQRGPIPTTATSPYSTYSPTVSYKRYEGGPTEDDNKIPTTATSPYSTFSLTPTYKRYHQSGGNGMGDVSSTSTTSSSSKIQFHTDDAGMMLESSDVQLKRNVYVPLSNFGNTKSSTSLQFQQESSGGPMLDATPNTSVPQPKPLPPLTPDQIKTKQDDQVAETSTRTTTSSSFVQGDDGQNLKLSSTENVPKPQISPPIQQYKPVTLESDSGGMMLQQSTVVPKPKPITPLTVDSIKTSGGNSGQDNKSTTTSQHQQQEKTYKLNDQSTPPSDEQYYKSQTSKEIMDSGITGKPRQPTLLWKQRESDYTGGDST